MNNSSPLIPQGSLQEEKNKGRARVRIAVFVVLAIHGVGLLALLMQGCKKEPETPLPSVDQVDTNTAPAFVEPTNAVPADATNVVTLPTNPPPLAEPLQPIRPQPVAPAGMATDYKVVKGDTFTSIAKKFHVTTRAISDANPGVDSAKLQIDQVLHIPAPAAPASPGGSISAGTGADAVNAQIFVVKSGDTLIGIAARFGVTVKALRAANNLTTDRIKVAQKLTIPAKAPATPSGTSAPSGGVPAGTAPVGQ